MAAAADLEASPPLKPQAAWEQKSAKSRRHGWQTFAVLSVLGTGLVVLLVVIFWADHKDRPSESIVTQPSVSASAVANVALTGRQHIQQVGASSFWAAACNVSSLTFTEIVYSNLMARRSGSDASSQEGVRFRDVFTFDNGTKVDLRIRVLPGGAYGAADRDPRSGIHDGFGCISMMVPATASFAFEFVASETSEPMSLSRFSFTLIDEDAASFERTSVVVADEGRDGVREALQEPLSAETPSLLEPQRRFTNYFLQPTSRFVLSMQSSNTSIKEKVARNFYFTGKAAASIGVQECMDR